MQDFSELEDDHSMSAMSDLNVTPLLDLAFVLLVIFMITAPFLTESAELIIPTSKASNDAVDPSKVAIVSIDRNRQIAFQSEPVALEDLPARLLAEREANPGMGVLIRSDRDVTAQRLVEIMDVLKQCQITRVGIVTKRDAAG